MNSIAFSRVSLALALCASVTTAKVYYVSATGSESGTGSLASPFKKIQAAADILQPGDTCYVRNGVYREWVKPARGGQSETQRIVYRAFPDESPEIKGSERISNWSKVSGNIWSAEVPDALFGSYNPFTKQASGPYLNWGGEHHLGDVYVDGKPLKEKFSRASLDTSTFTWFTEHYGSTTKISAQFGGKDPNSSLTEINVRESLFHPTKSGLGYITLDGFIMRHGASNWAANTGDQKGMVGTWGGRSWIIQRCLITDAKCAGIASTIVSGASNDINAIGHHLILDNTIERCGQAAIVGYQGLSSSNIERNILQDINYRMEFGGYETGAIKFHLSADMLIKGNIIRRVRSGGPGIFAGIWIDWANQGIRITGNLFKDIQDGDGVFVEMNHGPTLIDNNIFSGAGVTMGSDRTIVAHNLFASAQWRGDPYMLQGRSSGWNAPHTLRETGRGTPGINVGDRLYSNIFISKGPQAPVSTNDFRSGYNIYYQGAAKQGFDLTGISKSLFTPGFAMVDDTNGITVTFESDASPLSVGSPLITKNFIGSYATVNQGIEDKFGNPIAVDEDILGAKRSANNPTAGPMEKLQAGKNSFRMSVGRPLAISSIGIKHGPRIVASKAKFAGEKYTTDGKRFKQRKGILPAGILIY